MGHANYYTATIAGLTVYYSYAEPIAFRAPGGRLVVCRNEWSVTTGKHITQTDGGSKEARARRLSGEEFTEALRAAMQAASAPAVVVAHP